MALAHFWMKNLGRDTRSLPASVAVHYLKREAEFAPEAYLTRMSQQTQDREDLRDWGTQHLPPWAENNAAKFFSAAERYEGANRYHAIMLQFSLPKEMTPTQQAALTNDFIAATMHDKSLLWVKHEPLDKFSHEPQPHIHILLSARTVDGIERDAAQTFQRWNAAHPERGGCQKDLFWSRRQAVEQLRMAFADLTNMHAERAGFELRIDSRSLRRRDIDRKPMYANEDRPSRAALVAEQRQAAAAWEQRKVYKGYEHIQHISREEFVLRVRQAVREYEPGRELPRSRPEIVREWYEKEIQKHELALGRLDGYMQRLDQARALEQGYAARGRAPLLPQRQQSERVLAEARTHGLSPDLEAERAVRVLHIELPHGALEQGGGRAARVRIFDERRQRRRERDGYERT